MEKIDGSMVSSYGDGTREDFLFTYSDDEKEQHDLDRLNASLVLNPEFIPVYPKMLQAGYSLIEATVYGFIRFFLSNNSKFYCTDEQLALMLGCGERSISKAIKRLKEDGLITLSSRVKAGGGKIRFISLSSNCEIHSSEMGNSQGIDNKIILFNNTNVLLNAPSVQKGCFEDLWNAIPTKKGGDEEKGLEEFQKKVDSGCAVDDMIKLATLDKLEIREKISDVMYSRKKENWIHDFCSQDEDIMEARILAILRARCKRMFEGVKFKSNTVLELCDVFGKEYIEGLWKQVQKEYKDTH